MNKKPILCLEKKRFCLRYSTTKTVNKNNSILGWETKVLKFLLGSILGWGTKMLKFLLGSGIWSLKRGTSATPHLPDEVIFSGILSKLPIQSLLRFQSVNKVWNTAISDPNFVALHYLHSETRPALLATLMFKPRTKTERSRHNFFHFHFLQPTNPNPSCKLFSDSYNDFISACNGLICLKSDSGFGILNPCTLEGLDHPFPEQIEDWLLRHNDLPCRFRRGFISCGFGIDPLKNEYKYVHILVDKNTSMGFIYTLRTNSWREFTPPNTLLDSLREAAYLKENKIIAACYANGALYWFSSSTNKLISFDLHHEQFLAIDSPQYPSCLTYHSMIRRRGFLCLAYQDERYQNFIVIYLYNLMSNDAGLHSWGDEETILLPYKSSFPFTIVDVLGILVYKDGGFSLYNPQTKTWMIAPYRSQKNRLLRGYKFSDHIDNLLCLKTLLPPGSTQVQYFAANKSGDLAF